MTAVAIVAAAATVVILTAAVIAYRAAAAVPTDEHDPRTCRHCAPLRHPSRCAQRAALTRIPRQGGGRP